MKARVPLFEVLSAIKYTMDGQDLLRSLIAAQLLLSNDPLAVQEWLAMTPEEIKQLLDLLYRTIGSEQCNSYTHKLVTPNE